MRIQSLVGNMDHEALSPAANVKNDASLAARARAGDESAWSAIVELHWKQVWSLSRIIVRDEQGAEEAAQDTFRAVRDRLSGYPGDRSLCGWIQTICRQRALEELRRRTRRVDQAAAAGRPHAGPADVERALARLDPEEREALLLASAGSEPEELAAALGITAAAIRSRTARARVKLLDQLDRAVGGGVA